MAAAVDVAQLETFKYSETRQLVFGKNYVCVHQYGEGGAIQHFQGYLTLHTSSAGPIVSWTPFILMINTHYKDPEEPPVEADLAMLVAIHNVAEIVVISDPDAERPSPDQLGMGATGGVESHSSNEEGATCASGNDDGEGYGNGDGDGGIGLLGTSTTLLPGAELPMCQSVVFTGVDGVSLQPIVFHNGDAQVFMDALSEYTDISPVQQTITSAYRSVFAVQRLPTLEPPSRLQTPHPATFCSPPCDRCRPLLEAQLASDAANDGAPFSVLGLPRRAAIAAARQGVSASSSFFRLFRRAPSLTKEEQEAFVRKFQVDAAKRKLRRCLVAWRVCTYRTKVLAREVRELVIWDTQGLDETVELFSRQSCSSTGGDAACGDEAAPQVPRQPSPALAGALTAEKLAALQDEDGRIHDSNLVCSLVYAAGCDSGVRAVLWRYLLGLWRFEDSTEERQAAEDGVRERFRESLAAAEKLLAEEAEEAEDRDDGNDDDDGFGNGFADEHSFAHQCMLIDLDVDRCDRSLEYYKNEDMFAKRLQKLRRVLRAFVFDYRQPGYVQGMSDILEPILAVFDDEAVAFFCFSKLMRRIGPKFDRESERGIQGCMSRLRSLISFVDPELAEQLRAKEADHLYFCYRWFLLDFKREFPPDSVFAVWEVIWAGRVCVTKHFAIFLAAAVLLEFRGKLMACGSFPEILKLFNSLQATHDAHVVSRAARALVEDVRHRIIERADRRRSSSYV